jgi:hypothetical protein
MSVRSSVIAFAVVAVLGLIGLGVAGTVPKQSTAFSLDVPPTAPIVKLSPSGYACQGPIDAAAGFGSIAADLSSTVNPSPTVAPGPPIRLQVSSPSGAVIASAEVPGGYRQEGTVNFVLDRSVAAGRRIDVCLRTSGPGTAGVWGAVPGPGLAYSHVGSLRPGNVPGNAAIALLFIHRHRRSLLASLPAAFGRAALFRPGWVGSWTFWVLTAALLATFAAGGIAVAQAVRSDVSADRGSA